VLWTGGKDSALALHEARLAGFHVGLLATFAPPGARFRAHPLPFMQRQALAMGIPHRVFPIREPVREGYVAALRQLAESEHVQAVVTGDIAEVDGKPNWIRECSRGLELEVLTPLWQRDREELLEVLLGLGFRAVVSCVKVPWLTADWVGRELDRAGVESLRRVRAENGLDLCGENGEYHTLVRDGPPFERCVELGRYSVRSGDGLAYLDLGEGGPTVTPPSSSPRGTARGCRAGAGR
jgi:uncharacterized protein (TIGR00290 family)